MNVIRAAFYDELEKIALSRGRLNVVAQERKGVRPISVAKFLEKDSKGSLIKRTGNSEKIADGSGSTPIISIGEGLPDPGQAVRPKRRGEVPSKEDLDAVHRMDGRGEATTVFSQGMTFNNLGGTATSNAGSTGT